MWKKHLAQNVQRSVFGSVRMPSGPALVLEQQWQPVVWRKSAPSGQVAKSAAAVNQARRQGENVETSKKVNTGNRTPALPNARKLLDHAALILEQV